MPPGKTFRPSLKFLRNVRIFDVKSDQLSGSLNVLIQGNIIQKISAPPSPPIAGRISC